ncbi:pyridoxamine 5'-phosphate oxidase family protein [Sinorhizobium garamanticum]|uniref:Pyridoxamine 5'-phosphate oxidase family protein n=1 Tax=Sinorhizobium garamanticum TaxID=680247 RepID=A0ABY8DAT3_9HYPH|nr:pyridoxamine 5'-phosphate oxidase family protein [Sinorhizobium garamanticum]WEX86650.1 pyridoxamine 5'-phosphate oxidase family protein [Sinorhizobium garamanticum]
MPIERSATPIDTTRMTAVTRQLLDASTLCSIASVSANGQPHINTAYFAWDGSLNVVWMSEREAQHSQNVRTNGAVAIAVYDSSQVWRGPNRGIQLFGSADELEGEAVREAKAIYGRRFDAFAEKDFGSYCFYRCRLQRLKLFDEQMLGDATFVTARVSSNGELAWERTEVYRVM